MNHQNPHPNHFSVRLPVLLWMVAGMYMYMYMPWCAAEEQLPPPRLPPPVVVKPVEPPAPSQGEKDAKAAAAQHKAEAEKARREKKEADAEIARLKAELQRAKEPKRPLVIAPPPATEIIDNRYQILANGAEVKDLQTHLIWQRCEVGKTWDGNTCNGKDKGLNFDDAQKQAGNGWRVPSIDELKTLLTKEKVNARFIHPKIFPNTNSFVWSGSPYAYGTGSAWYVYFGAGYSSNGNRYNVFGVRLVRGGQ